MRAGASLGHRPALEGAAILGWIAYEDVFDEKSCSLDQWWRCSGNERRNPRGDQNGPGTRHQHVGCLPGILGAD
jgi:hypothetical protein